NLSHLLKGKIERTLRANERRGEADIEADALRFELATGGARFFDAVFGEIDLAPAGEQVFQIPLALAVAHEHENSLTHPLSSVSHCPSMIPKSGYRFSEKIMLKQKSKVAPSVKRRAGRERRPSNKVRASCRAPIMRHAAHRGRKSCDLRPGA